VSADLGDVWMIERGEDLRFAMTARAPVGIGGERIRQDFQRDVATEFGIAGAIHLTHSAFANGGNNLIGAKTASEAYGHEVLVRVTQRLWE
jgi:hypothetical protein